MSTSKHIDKICCIVLAVTLALTLFFMNAGRFGVQAVSAAVGYASRLFDDSEVHTIDIIMDDWDSFIENCTDEKYVDCTVIIDGDAYRNVAIRAKGNTSLSSVAAYGNDRYSFKIEFDHYDNALNYYGLDKLCLNNIIQDNTYMKDYLTYRLMYEFGADAPLCSYAYITVNGEDWGLYLAVEGVEESFLQRNYGNDYGELYKPDSTKMGGGPGNGRAFRMEEFDPEMFAPEARDSETSDPEAHDSEMLDPEAHDFEMSDPEAHDFEMLDPEAHDFEMLDPEAHDFEMSDPEAHGPEGFRPENLDRERSDADAEGFHAPAPQGNMPDPPSRENPDRKEGAGGPRNDDMTSSDTSLIYTDDAFDSYSNIFENAKTDPSDSDKSRLIESLKKLNSQEALETVVDIAEVIRYFVVHNFVLNFDSYTGSLVHNYYLYEKDGQLSMIPWDYNLAFGAFESRSNATELVNYPIDTPVSGGTTDSRPMLAWILDNEEYTDLYHQYFEEFLDKYFESGYFTSIIDSTAELIAPYVEADPTKFCTTEEFETGVSTLRSFCLLRAESITGQLAGTIPSTSDGQAQDDSALIDASDLEISDTGSMGDIRNHGGGNANSHAAPTLP